MEENRDRNSEPLLCLGCNYEGARETFGANIRCPQCTSNNIVNAEFWHRFKIENEQESKTRKEGMRTE